MKHSFKSKYGNKKTEVDGHTFDSILEAKYYTYLKQLKAAGLVLTFLLQPAFHLPGKTVYRADFQVFWENGNVDFIDVKGKETDAFIRSKKQVEDIYSPIKIKVVKRGDF